MIQGATRIATSAVAVSEMNTTVNRRWATSQAAGRPRVCIHSTSTGTSTSTPPGQAERALVAERQALAGAIPAAGPNREGLLMLLAGLLLAGATAALLIRRLAPADSRYARRH